MWTQNQITQSFSGVRIRTLSTEKNRFKKKPANFKQITQFEIALLIQHLQINVYNPEPYKAH